MKNFINRLIYSIYLYQGARREAHKRYSAIDCQGCQALAYVVRNDTDTCKVCKVCGRPLGEIGREMYFVAIKRGV